jgi:hypothetical protein
MQLSSAGARGARRWAAATLLLLVVSWLHFLLAGQLPYSRLGSGAADSRPKRLDISFVRELAPAAPPAVAPRMPPAATRPGVPAAAAAASAASAPMPSEVPPAETRAEVAPEPPAAAASAAPESLAEAQPAVMALADPPEPAASAPFFEWPPSTRLSYQLTGNFRGPVEGQASVEWLRSGGRYQVLLDISVGPSFAPLVSRRLSSDGELTADGLRPRRYDEETKVALREPRRLSIFFDDESVRLPGGKVLPLPPGVQDTASQFVQLTWMFTTRPELLETGRSVEIPLALPRYLDRWLYEVLERETLDTPVGPIETVHVKPRRDPRPGVELTAEVWVAPSLQYLPVRIVIRQDADTWVDLRVTRLPQQEAAVPTGR